MGVLDRLILRDRQWERMAAHIIGDARTRGSSGRDNRLFVEAVLWVVRTGSPWRDLPDGFGSWNNAFRRFSRWSAKGVWHRIFAAMSDDPDFEYLRGGRTVIPNNPSRALKHPLDKPLYRERHLIECCISKLKQFRRVATRYEKAARNYLSIVTLAATVLWLR